jgi:hypothetical protein
LWIPAKRRLSREFRIWWRRCWRISCAGAAITTDGLDLLEPVERRLVEHVERGELLDLAVGHAVDEPAMRTWGKSRTVRASVFRDILAECKKHAFDCH